VHKYKLKQWFKSFFDFESLAISKHPRAKRLSVELLEIRLTPDANAIPALHYLGNAVLDNNSAANSITLVDDIRLLQNATDYRANQVYFCSNNSSKLLGLDFQTVNKLDAVALQAAATKGVVLIDSSLVATIPANELKGSLVVSIDGNRDVVSQITTALEGLANVPVLRIISHGNDGVLWFGNQAFDSTDLTSSAMQVASWGKSLTADGDILLYGCSIANTDAGKAFVGQLALLAGADVAASTNPTGTGGDIYLEFFEGVVTHSFNATLSDFENKGITLDTSSEIEQNFWNHLDGTGTIDIKFNVDGLNGSQTLYLFRNGNLVDSQSGFTNGSSRVFRYTGAFSVGNNVFRLSPFSNDATWLSSGSVNKVIGSIVISGPSSFTANVLQPLNSGAGIGYNELSTTAGRIWTATNLPPGLSIRDSDGLVSGTPTIAGNYSAAIKVSNGFANNTQSVAFNIAKLTPTINFIAPAAITYGTLLSSTQLNATSLNNGGLLFLLILR
jgi:hypothetical protein